MGAIKFEEFLTIKDVARLVGCSVRYLHNEIKKGDLKAMRIGRQLKFEHGEVVKWAKRKTI